MCKTYGNRDGTNKRRIGHFNDKNSKLKNYQKNYYREIPIPPKLKPYVNRIREEKWTIPYTTMMNCIGNFTDNHSLKDLRHTFTTRARECDVENELVAVWTGHSLGNITSSVYTHFSMEFQKREMQKLAY